MSYIQLPDGLKKNVVKIQLNLPKDEKARDLLEHLPYLANLKDPISQNRVENLLKTREDLQKYLLVTEDLNKTIGDSLQLAVTHGKLNDAAAVRNVSERSDPNYNFFKKNDNPLDVLYKEQARFDVQNPVIGTLLKEINRGKQTYEGIEKTLDKGPDPRTLDLEERWRKIFEKNKPKDKGLATIFRDSDDDDDDDMSPGSPAVPPAPPNPTDDDRFLPPGFKLFGNDPGPPLVRTARENDFPYGFRIQGAANDPKFEDEIVLDGNLRKVFPEANMVFNDFNDGGIKIEEDEEYADFSDKLDRGEIPEELQFFSGGSENINLLYNEIKSHNLTSRNQECIEYLATDECRDALGRDGISIYVPSRNIFINNENTGESLYTFLNNQQDESKKEIPLDFTYDDDYTDYMTKYLPAMNEFDESKHDFLTNKNSKFLFHLFNKYQEDRGRSNFHIRHSTLTDDNYALNALQDRNWPYFINSIIEFSQGFINLSDFHHSDATEINILNNTRANFEIVKTVYNEMFTSVGINLHEFFKNVEVIDKQRIDNDLTNNNYLAWDSQEDFIQQRILTTYRDFYYETDRFPGRPTSIPIPRGRVPDFIQSQDVLSPRSLYETYVGRDMQRIVSLQFLAAFNRFFFGGGDAEVSRDAMSEFFHNLSWQVLTNDNDSIQPEFEAVTVLIRSINLLIRQQIYESMKEQIQKGEEVLEKLTSKEKEDNKTEIEKIEERVVDDIIQIDQTDYTSYFELPTIKTEEEIDEDRK